MGVKGLSTFLSGFRGHYSDTLLIRNQYLVIDGSNLMYYIYFKDSRRHPHLFGGDFVSYAQRLREFFDRLRLACIIPVVILDGAFEKEKMDTVLKRFLNWLQAALKVDIKSLNGGKHQHSVWISVIFHEIMFEKNVLQFQTEWDADDTIALVAKHLNCAILSLDSDFYIYKELKIIPLNGFSFKERFSPADKIALNVSAKKKIFAFRCVCLSAQRLWNQKFNIKDVQLLTLATALLGNDYIKSGVFRRLLFKMNGPNLKRFERINNVLIWIGQQNSFDSALEKMLNCVNEENRQQVRDTLFFILKSYMGESGELKILERIRVALRIPAEEQRAKSDDEEDDEGINEDVECDEKEDPLPSEELEQLSLDRENEFSDSDEDIDLPKDLQTEISAQAIGLPEWFLELYYRCIMPSYLIKIAYNKAVLLYGQVEVESMPMSHTIATPIIQVTAGIILGVDTIVLVTKEGAKVAKTLVPTKVQLEHFGQLINLPCLLSNDNYMKTLKIGERQKIFLVSLDLTESEIKLVYDWPVSMQMLIACVLTFVKKVGSPNAMSVALAVVISCIHAFLFAEKGPAAVSTNWRSDHVDEINDLLHRMSGPKSKTQCFYKKYERIPDTHRDFIFRDSYDKKKVYDFTQFKCVLYHSTMLNKLLGNPFRPTSATSLHCHVIYNSFTKIAEYEYRYLDFIDRSFDGGFSQVLKTFITFTCKTNNIHLNGYFAKGKKQNPPPKKEQTKARLNPNPNDKPLNRFAFLNDDDC